MSFSIYIIFFYFFSRYRVVPSVNVVGLLSIRQRLETMSPSDVGVFCIEPTRPVSISLAQSSQTHVLDWLPLIVWFHLRQWKPTNDGAQFNQLSRQCRRSCKSSESDRQESTTSKLCIITREAFAVQLQDKNRLIEKRGPFICRLLLVEARFTSFHVIMEIYLKASALTTLRD